MTRAIDPARVRADAPNGVAMTPLAYRIKDACAQLGISRTTLWRLIAAGEIPTRKIGGVTIIPGDALRALAGAYPQPYLQSEAGLTEIPSVQRQRKRPRTQPHRQGIR